MQLINNVWKHHSIVFLNGQTIQPIFVLLLVQLRLILLEIQQLNIVLHFVLQLTTRIIQLVFV